MFTKLPEIPSSSSLQNDWVHLLLNKTFLCILKILQLNLLCSPKYCTFVFKISDIEVIVVLLVKQPSYFNLNSNWYSKYCDNLVLFFRNFTFVLCYMLSCILLKFIFWSLTSSTSYAVKMRSYWGRMGLYTVWLVGVLIKRGSLDTDVNRKCHVKIKAKMRVMFLHTQECQKLGKRLGTVSLHSP